jgi:hypothetical protein
VTEHGPMAIKTPRDRKGSFEPQSLRKGQRRFEGFDDKILALYSRGLSVRDIEAHLHEIYGVKVGRDLISRVPSLKTSERGSSGRLRTSTRSVNGTPARERLPGRCDACCSAASKQHRSD